MLSSPAVAALNHLLAQSGWAQPRLAKFCGRTARVRIAPLSFAWTVQDDGLVRAAANDASADATLVIPPTLLPRLALQEDRAYALIERTGDGALIEEILFLAHNLRWDAAEDISRFTGDIAAERIVHFARNARDQVRNTALNLSQALAEYWTEERPLVAKRISIADFARQVATLRDDVEGLAQRIERLGKRS